MGLENVCGSSLFFWDVVLLERCLTLQDNMVVPNFKG